MTIPSKNKLLKAKVKQIFISTIFALMLCIVCHVSLLLYVYIVLYSPLLPPLPSNLSFHPGGSGHPVASFQPSRLQIQLAKRKSFQLCEIASLPPPPI